MSDDFLHVIIRSACLCLLADAKHPCDAVNNDVEHGDEEDTENGGKEHAPDNGNTHTVTRCSSGAGCHAERQTADDTSGL